MIMMLLLEKMVPQLRLSSFYLFIIVSSPIVFATFESCWFCFAILLWQNYTEFVGKKSSFRLLNRGSAKALDKVVDLDGMCTGLCLTMPFIYC